MSRSERSNDWKSFIRLVNPRSGYIMAALVIAVYCMVYSRLLSGGKSFSNDAFTWFGSFLYFLENMSEGIFPYWDPYPHMGTYFYPNISGYGLLDPVMILCVLFYGLFDISPLTLFTYFRLYRLIIFAAGSYLLFSHTSGNRTASAISAGILLFVATAQNIRQPMMDLCYLVPLACYLILQMIESRNRTKQLIYFFSLILVTGITMNVYVPSLYLFSLVLFVAGLVIFRNVRIRNSTGDVSRPGLAIAVVAGVLLVLMMAAPPLSVMLFDAGPDGELFAVSKLIDSNDIKFKKMTASDLGGDRFFDSFRKDNAVFLSVGSLASFFFPDIAALRTIQLRDNGVLISMYMGIIPLSVIGIGMAYCRTAYIRTMAFMLCFLSAIAFNINGVNGEYSTVQKFINTVFPPLRMTDMRVNAASMISFSLCLLYGLSVSSLASKGRLSRLTRGNFRGIMLLSLLPVAAKAAISVHLNGVITSSLSDAAALAAGFLVPAGIIAVRTGRLREGTVIITLLLASFLDIALAGRLTESAMRSTAPVRTMLEEKEDYRNFSLRESMREFDGFEYFRQLYVPSSLLPFSYFSESIMKVKGAMINSHYGSIFTTKRYYDLFAMLSPEKQMAIGGVLYPVAGFYPLDSTVMLQSDAEALRRIETSDKENLGRYLLLQNSPSPSGRPAGKPALSDYEDLDWYEKYEELNVHKNLIPYMKEIRSKIGVHLSNDISRLRMESFDINSITFSVENSVGGYLFYNDGWSRYWKAYDNDERLAVRPANYNGKAVLLKPGSHKVRFVFDPVHYKIGLLLYISGLGITVACILFAVIRSRKRRSKQS